jgi:Heterokaryon incompatibility protein (HET)
MKFEEDYKIEWLLEVFDMKSSPPFIALSYEWGENSTNRSIRLNDYDILIRENLYQALASLTAEVQNSDSDLQRHTSPFSALLEHNKRTLFLWVDALCIDQGCRSEREIQVANMGQIYSHAAAVLVWLGLQDENSHKLIRCLELQEENVCKGHCQGLQSALSSILNRSYWSRMWIVQEIYLAKELYAGCGDHFLQWDSLGDVLDLRSQIGSADVNDLTNTKAWPIIQQRMSRGAEGGRILKRRLDKNIMCFGDRKCSDTRDRVYSLLGVSWTDNLLLVDYSIDNDELFVRVVNSINWEDEVWRGSTEIEHFGNFVRYLCRSLEVNRRSTKVQDAVKDIRSRINKEYRKDIASKVATYPMNILFPNRAKCVVS